MPSSRAEQLQLFDSPAAAAAGAIGPTRLAAVRKAVFGNLTALKNATPAQIAAPAFADWHRRFEELVARLPADERAEAMATMDASTARIVGGPKPR